MDGAWAVSRGKLCIYTSNVLCTTVHVAGEAVTLIREDGVLEYAGATTAFKPLAADNATSPITEFPLLEKFLPGSQPRSGKGRTLFYYIHGFDGRARVHSPMLQYFMARFQKTEGWDVVDADYPLAISSQLMRFQASNYAAAAFVARRLKELKAQGYDRIFVGGQSWGGWTTLSLSGQSGLPLGGAILVVPARCGWSVNGSARNDPEYLNNKIYFDQMIARTRYPIATVFFTGDEFEPADRGESAVRLHLWRLHPRLPARAAARAMPAAAARRRRFPRHPLGQAGSRLGDADARRQGHARAPLCGLPRRRPAQDRVRRQDRDDELWRRRNGGALRLPRRGVLLARGVALLPAQQDRRDLLCARQMVRSRGSGARQTKRRRGAMVGRAGSLARLAPAWSSSPNPPDPFRSGIIVRRCTQIPAPKAGAQSRPDRFRHGPLTSHRMPNLAEHFVDLKRHRAEICRQRQI
jgi:hypothetical protein